MPTYPATTLVKGSVYPQLQRVQWKFDPVRGWNIKSEYHSANQATAILLQGSYAMQGIASVLTLEKDRAALEVDDSTYEYAIDSWEIAGEEETLDLFAHPNAYEVIAAWVGASNLDGLAAVGAALRQHLSQDDPATTAFAGPAYNSGPPPTGNPLYGFRPGGEAYAAFPQYQDIIAQFYKLYLLGTTGFLSSRYVLKHKTNVSNRWSVNIADFGVNQIYTPGQLISEVSNNNLWAFPLPGRLQYKLSAIPAPDPQTGYEWGWLKGPSTETSEARNRVNIDQNYTLYLWNTSIYVPYSG